MLGVADIDAMVKAACQKALDILKSELMKMFSDITSRLMSVEQRLENLELKLTIKIRLRNDPSNRVMGIVSSVLPTICNGEVGNFVMVKSRSLLFYTSNDNITLIECVYKLNSFFYINMKYIVRVFAGIPLERGIQVVQTLNISSADVERGAFILGTCLIIFINDLVDISTDNIKLCLFADDAKIMKMNYHIRNTDDVDSSTD